MVRPARLLLPLLVMLPAACGAGEPDGPASSARGARPAPVTPGPLTVSAVDGRIGDATTVTPAGVRELPVGPRRIDPDRIRRDTKRREGVGAGATCADTDLMPSAETMAAVLVATMCLVNGERQDAGLPQLGWNDRLATSSVAHSRDMVAHGYFSHTSRDGRSVADRIRATGYINDDAQWTVGENLAWGTGTLATPRSIVQAWMDSAGHRANILRVEFREAGLGLVNGNPASTDGDGATYTMNFGAIGALPVQAEAVPVAAAVKKPVAKKRRSCARKSSRKARKACRSRAARRR